MPDTPFDSRERCDDLLIQDALFGLDQTEQIEMNELMRHQELHDTDRFKSMVGALDVGLDARASRAAGSRKSSEGISAELRQSIIDDAARHLKVNEGNSQISSAVGTSSEPKSKTLVGVASRSTGWSSREKVFGLVTAASLLFALASMAGWLDRGVDKPDPGMGTSVALSVSGKRDRLLADTSVPDLHRVAWTATEDPAAKNASGEVIWSDLRQEGFMVFKGLPVNDPNVEQYQLWIFDTVRDDKHPVDGGVFDVNSDGEVIVAIDSRLKVAEAKMFAVTIEIPGGVVVSERERLPLLAVVD